MRKKKTLCLAESISFPKVLKEKMDSRAGGEESKPFGQVFRLRWLKVCGVQLLEHKDTKHNRSN